MKLDFRLTSSLEFTLYPLAWLAAAFAAGIIACSSFTSSAWLWLITVFITAFTALLLKHYRLAASTALIAAFFCAGGLFCQAERSSVGPERLKVLYDSGICHSGEPVEVTGTVSRGPELTVNGFFLWFSAETLRYENSETRVSGTVRLFVPISNNPQAQGYEDLAFEAGDKIRAAVGLKREERYLNPGVRRAKENLDRQGIDVTGTIKSPDDLEKLSTGNSPLAFIFRWRRELLTTFQQNFNGPTAGVLIASLLGNKYFLDKRTGEAFREGGTFHILVISGAHITLFGTLIVWLLSFVTRSKIWLFLISNFLLWAYTLAVGAEAPVARAALMFTILSFSYIVYRQGTLLNALGARTARLETVGCVRPLVSTYLCLCLCHRRGRSAFAAKTGSDRRVVSNC